MSTSLVVGRKAPAFSLPDQDGQTVKLSELKGQWVVLYFYPKDDTPGCTAEACSFRDLEGDIAKAGAVILGVSTDPLESHAKFTSKYKLNFPLLSDQTADVSKMYGAWREKNLNGRRTWGVARMTYWIGSDGRIKKVYKNVDAAKHGNEILADIQAARSRR